MTQQSQNAAHPLCPGLIAAAKAAKRTDRLTEAQEMAQAIRDRRPDMVIDKVVMSGLWSMYSDLFAAGWMSFDADDDQEVSSITSWIEDRDEEYRERAENDARDTQPDGFNHGVLAAARAQTRPDRFPEAEEIRQAVLKRRPSLQVTVEEIAGLWSGYSDLAAAGWLGCDVNDPVEIDGFIDWALRVNSHDL